MGSSLGLLVGSSLGLLVGSSEGAGVGQLVGAAVGLSLGSKVGSEVGSKVGGAETDQHEITVVKCVIVHTDTYTVYVYVCIIKDWVHTVLVTMHCRCDSKLHSKPLAICVFHSGS